MKKRTPPEIKVPGKFDPQIRLLIIYFVTTLVVLWVWQELVSSSGGCDRPLQ